MGDKFNFWSYSTICLNMILYVLCRGGVRYIVWRQYHVMNEPSLNLPRTTNQWQTSLSRGLSFYGSIIFLCFRP